jgi:hypothetical protein
MPTNRHKITRNLRLKAVDTHILEYLRTGTFDAERCGVSKFTIIDDDQAQKVWRENGKFIVKDWIKTAPGTRPYGFWEFEAPEQRKRLGGVGDPEWEHLSGAEIYDKGIPAKWVDAWDVDYYNGRARTVDGKPFKYELATYKEGDFTGKAIDPKAPPVYESEATYLTRLGLLLPGEAGRLTKKDFDPVTVEPDEM